MTEDDSKNIFKVMGKIIQLGNLSADGSNSLKTCSVTFGKQQSGNDYQVYDSLSTSIIPLQQAVGQVIATLDGMEAAVTQGMQNYLQSLIDDLDLSAPKNSSQVLDALDAVLADNELYVTPSGTYWSFFKDNLNYSFPLTPRSEAIPDEWITTTIVA